MLLSFVSGIHHATQSQFSFALRLRGYMSRFEHPRHLCGSGALLRLEEAMFAVHATSRNSLSRFNFGAACPALQILHSPLANAVCHV